MIVSSFTIHYDSRVSRIRIGSNEDRRMIASDDKNEDRRMIGEEHTSRDKILRDVVLRTYRRIERIIGLEMIEERRSNIYIVLNPNIRQEYSLLSY